MTAATPSGLLKMGIPIPQAGRVEGVFWRARAATSTVNMRVWVHPTGLFQTSGASQLLSADIEVGSDQNGSALKGAGTTAARLVEAVRDLPRDGALFIELDGGGTVDDLQVEVVGFTSGHVNTDSQDD